jgi:hypothetical protein
VSVATLGPPRDRRLGAEPRQAKIAGAAVLASVGLTAVALIAESLLARREAPPPEGEGDRGAIGKTRSAESRDVHASAAALCGSVLADSAVEHYRGGFENPGMFAALAVSALGLAAGADGATGARLPKRAREGGYALAALTGLAGLGFHVYNLLRQPGGLSWLNLFYAAPVGAPGALALAGALGLAAEQTDRSPEERPQIARVPAGRALAGAAAAGLAGAVGEAGLLHYRGAFQNPFMWIPVSAPPIAAALTAKAALESSAPKSRPLTRLWLKLTVLLGLAGVGFHIFGVGRQMGGWRNWRQNLLDGPPLPAPPSFSAVALAGLAALRLRDREDG